MGLDPVTLPDDKDVRDVVAGLLGQQKIPQEKYDAPTTSAQEVGWFYEPLVQPNPKFQHGLHQGDATKFAENYTLKMAGARRMAKDKTPAATLPHHWRCPRLASRVVSVRLRAPGTLRAHGRGRGKAAPPPLPRVVEHAAFEAVDSAVVHRPLISWVSFQVRTCSTACPESTSSFRVAAAHDAGTTWTALEAAAHCNPSPYSRTAVVAAPSGGAASGEEPRRKAAEAFCWEARALSTAVCMFIEYTIVR